MEIMVCASGRILSEFHRVLEKKLEGVVAALLLVKTFNFKIGDGGVAGSRI